MLAKVSNGWISLEYASETEQEQLKSSFSRKIRDWKFRTKGKGWDGDVNYLKFGNRLKIGLWHELNQECQKYNFPVKFQGLGEIIKQPDEKFIRHFCDQLLANANLGKREYQIDSVIRALKYKYCLLSLATRAGKTLIEFMYIMYLKYTGQCKQVMIVCPDSDLVIQTYNDFQEYTGGTFKLNICQVHGKSSLKDIEGYDIVIGNFQTMSNRPEAFFSGVSHLIVDEAHRADAASVKYICDSCTNVVSRIGMTGTLKEDRSAEHYNLLAYFGPIVKRVTKKYLMDNGYATPIKIVIFVLDYLPEHLKRELALLKENKVLEDVKLYEKELEIMRRSKARKEWLTKLLVKCSGNSLIYFSDIQGGFGKDIVDQLRKNTNNKTVFYIDGNVKGDMRQTYIKRMDKNEGVYMVSSYDTMSTGKTIKNLHNIVLAEPRRSFKVIGQSMGRGMTLHKGKDEYLWIDIVDNFKYHDPKENIHNTNILYRQMADRQKIYREEGFSYEIKHVKLTNSNMDFQTDEY